MGFFDFFKRAAKLSPDMLTIAVQRLAYLECARDGKPENAGLRFTSLGGVFGITPALRTQDDLIFVSDPQLKLLKLTYEAALTIGAENAADTLVAPEVEDGLMRWDHHGAEILAMVGHGVAPRLSLKGAPVVMVPREGLVLMAGADDPQALTRMLDQAQAAYRESEKLVSLRAVWWGTQPIPSEWLPPQGHELRSRFRLAAAQTRIHEAQGRHFVYATQSAPLGHLAVLDQHGGVLTAAWMRDADVVIPQVDWVVLHDTDDVALPRLEVDLETLRDVCGESFEELGPDEEREEPLSKVELDEPGWDPLLNKSEGKVAPVAPLLRLLGVLFPTLTERRFMVQRMAPGANSSGERMVLPQLLLAEWDRGEPVLARAAPDISGLVTLRSPDGRSAICPVSRFGARMEQRSFEEQYRFQLSFVTAAMSRAADGKDEGDAEVPQFPQRLFEQAKASRPLLMSSHDIRGVQQQRRNRGPAFASFGVVEVFATWEPSQLFPLVRPPGFSDGARSNRRGMALGSLRVPSDVTVNVAEPELVFRPSVERLRLDLVSDRVDHVMVVTQEMLDPAHTQSAWRTALLNLECASLQPFRSIAAGCYVGPWEDSYDFSRVLLLPQLLQSCRVKGKPLVFAPTIGKVWVTGSDDAAGLTTVLAAIDAHFESGEAATPYGFRQILFGWPWTVRDGSLVRAKVPPAISTRIAALDAQLARRRESSRDHVKDFAQAAYSGQVGREKSE